MYVERVDFCRVGKGGLIYGWLRKIMIEIWFRRKLLEIVRNLMVFEILLF